MPPRKTSATVTPSVDKGAAASKSSVSKAVSADFSFFAPAAKSVSVAGCFNKWSATADKLTKDAKGNWKTSIRLKPGQYQYRFVVDGNWTDDPTAREAAYNEFGSRNSILKVS